MIPAGSGIVKNVALFDARGVPISEKSTIDYLSGEFPEICEFEVIRFAQSTSFIPHEKKAEIDEIVEVRGSSSCFEYQFPAAPQYFIGRGDVLQEVNAFVDKVVAGQTSSRGFVFEANSGWGKSSTVLSVVEHLTKMGHLALAIDSRSASSSQFILQVIDYTISKVREQRGLFSGVFDLVPITGFEGAIFAVERLGRMAAQDGKLIFVFLDQFENVLFLPEALRRIRDLLLKLCDMKVNFVLGFSWKADLVGATSEFPFQLRDDILQLSHRVKLSKFSETETSLMIEKLSGELHTPIRADLEFLLSEYSQGYPWLLKKLCAHVKSLRAAKVSQFDIANSRLNVEELFQEDLRGLSAEEEDALRGIARLAPISMRDLGEEFKASVVQSLVDSRLVVRIGHKFDIYWDIFRDYLNIGLVPSLENYIMRVQVGSVINIVARLADNNGRMQIADIKKDCNLTTHSLYNVLRDLRLAGIAIENNGELLLKISRDENESFDDSIKAHLKDRLMRNRIVFRILEVVDAKHSVGLDELGVIMAHACPYIRAAEQTWRTYARVFADWIDTAGLAIFDRSHGVLLDASSGVSVAARRVGVPIGRRGVLLPQVQYQPTMAVLEVLCDRVATKPMDISELDLREMTPSTRRKAIGTLHALGIISREGNRATLEEKVIACAKDRLAIDALMKDAFLRLETVQVFLEVLKSHSKIKLSLADLGDEYRKSLGMGWTTGTAIYNTKIVLDWARSLGLAPGTFAATTRRKR